MPSQYALLVKRSAAVECGFSLAANSYKMHCGQETAPVWTVRRVAHTGNLKRITLC